MDPLCWWGPLSSLGLLQLPSSSSSSRAGGTRAPIIGVGGVQAAPTGPGAPASALRPRAPGLSEHPPSDRGTSPQPPPSNLGVQSDHPFPQALGSILQPPPLSTLGSIPALPPSDPGPTFSLFSLQVSSPTQEHTGCQLLFMVVPGGSPCTAQPGLGVLSLLPHPWAVCCPQ